MRRFHENRRDKSFTWVRLVAVCAIALLLALTASMARAQTYEHFDYPAGSPINGATGGAGWGANAWVGTGDNVVSPGLSVTSIVRTR